MYLELVDCSPKYWEFIRVLRTNKKVAHGFIQTDPISAYDQIVYMGRNWPHYRVCLYEGKPVGYIGLIGPNNTEISYCTEPLYWKMGIGRFMLESVLSESTDYWAKVKVDNDVSIRVFERLGLIGNREGDFIVFKQNVA